ncbi:transcriptional regulator [Dulcicalothrix desertica PCC 7102]|uniref:Transcriptional regulator n=1 Tax=Dulcicalothrix desertica PCC 7102 TaxID=232991 RepID=A0A433VLL4_9CYAN|nr:response regulator [Dulcicalothrix desertica]RUT07043.1 transcriptional regulator [Dulcicalothrix desertica PCC 7102]TWH61959.1 diguanylate cyclase (GGDEF)-like protein [Dulcicalothrix desertica PCC 7102]
MRILVVEDDELIVQSLVATLTQSHHTVDTTSDGVSGLEFTQVCNYDLIVLDVMLPKLDGISLCRQIRASGASVPIILLTAQDSSNNKIIGLDAGADDYITKPFNLQELTARIRALLRRGNTLVRTQLEWENLRLDPSSCEVTYNDQLIRLTPKEYSLLELFLRNPARTFSSGAIIDHLWSLEETPGEDTVRAHMKGLRQKLRFSGVTNDPIENVYGIGYRLKSLLDEKKKKPKSKKPLQNTTSNQTTISNPPSIKQSQQISAIWQRSQEKLSNRVTNIELAVAALLQGVPDSEMINNAYQDAHKLAGSLGMFGFECASRLSSQIEQLLQVATSLSHSSKLHLSELVVSLRQELQQASTINSGAEVKNKPLQGHLNDFTELTTRLQQSQSSARVLIVDDDMNILETLSEILKPWGLEITTLDNPLQFWDTLIATAPDLVVLDVEMPSISGIELCQQLRNDPIHSGLPVLFLTAHSSSDIMLRVFAAGADDYVTKPVVGPEIVARILNRIERTRLLRNFAQIDPLTGLVNRQKLKSEINQLLKEAQCHNQALYLVALQINNLQQINDKHNHSIGDQVLSLTGKVLKQTFNQQVVCRWAGAEFILCLYKTPLEESKNLIFNCIRDIKEKVLNINKGQEVEVSINMGISQYSQDGTNLEALYHMATSRCKG